MKVYRWLIFILIIVAIAIWIDLPNNPGIHIAGINRDIETRLGLDLVGGVQALLEADLPEGTTVDSEKMRTATRIVENRVNGLGVTEALVQQAGDKRIVVELPGGLYIEAFLFIPTGAFRAFAAQVPHGIERAQAEGAAFDICVYFVEPCTAGPGVITLGDVRLVLHTSGNFGTRDSRPLDPCRAGKIVCLGLAGLLTTTAYFVSVGIDIQGIRLRFLEISVIDHEI